MSKRFKTETPSPPGSISPTDTQKIETSIRQLTSNGNFRTALESAKQFHKAQATSASESLLIDAYAARIRSLLDQNLTIEAKSLLDLVRHRFPSSEERLGNLQMATVAREGDLSVLLAPLNEPDLSPERRAAIEQIVQSEVTDLKALADCPVLPPENPLRKAAAALDRAFTAATSGPVTPEEIALPEVSHRSALAPWKLLIHAIAAFHRSEDEACLNHLAAIRLGSVPARLAPAMRAMLWAKGSDNEQSFDKAAKPLKSAELSLLSRTTVNWTELRAALVNLDRAFDEYDETAPIFKAVRNAVKECERTLPDRLAELKQLITVRAGVEYMDTDRLTAALGGAARTDARFFRMYARAMEGTGDTEDIAEACDLWHEFGVHAVREGWFQANSVERATLYLHMAGLLRRIPRVLLFSLQETYDPNRASSACEAAGEADKPYLNPEELYRRACAMDPHPESFSQWMLWATEQSKSSAEQVALEWHRARPEDIAPLLHLMLGTEKRAALTTALSYLAKAERIDAVHPEVRTARLRLMSAVVLRHIQQEKTHLAKPKLAAIASLPQAQQGDRPAFLSALRHLIALTDRDETAVSETWLELESLMGGRVGGALLLVGLAASFKYLDFEPPPPIKDLSSRERSAVPSSLARVLAIADDIGIRKFKVPAHYIEEAEKQLPSVCDSLDSEQIRRLGDLGILAGSLKLAWDASQAGMMRRGPMEAYFLLMRARAMPPGFSARGMVIAAAAAELGRVYRDMEVVNRAVEMVRNPAGGDSLTLSIEDARNVLQNEITSGVFPTRFNPGPDYRHFFAGAACTCLECRQGGRPNSRATESEDDSTPEIEELERSFKRGLPKGMPPAFAETFLEMVREGFRAGESSEEVMARIFGKSSGKSASRKETGQRKK